MSKEILDDAAYYFKYAYAVYSLLPKFDNPSSLLDVACWKPPAPASIVFHKLSEWEEIRDDESIDLLHLNCSNRVLAHLPYMLALDHSKRAVVIAIR